MNLYIQNVKVSFFLFEQKLKLKWKKLEIALSLTLLYTQEEE